MSKKIYENNGILDMIKNMITGGLSYKENYHEIFEHDFVELRFGLLIFFTITAIVYTIEFTNTKYTKTILGSDEAKEFYVQTILNSFFGSILIGYVLLSRGKNWNAIFLSVFMIFAILFMFDISLEASGFNRYMANDDTLKGIGIYAELDKTTQENISKVATRQGNELPFVTAFMHSVIGIGSAYFIVKIISMLIASYYGYKDENGCNLISNTKFFGGSLSPTIGFALEILITGLTPITVLCMQNKFSNKPFGNKQLMTTVLMTSMLICGHVVFQYAGMYCK